MSMMRLYRSTQAAHDAAGPSNGTDAMSLHANEERERRESCCLLVFLILTISYVPDFLSSSRVSLCSPDHLPDFASWPILYPHCASNALPCPMFSNLLLHFSYVTGAYLATAHCALTSNQLLATKFPQWRRCFDFTPLLSQSCSSGRLLVVRIAGDFAEGKRDSEALLLYQCHGLIIAYVL